MIALPDVLQFNEVTKEAAHLMGFLHSRALHG